MDKGISAVEHPNEPFPHFLIIGAQKCGTTSLYHYLGEHPQIVSALCKEIHFFDIFFKKGFNWYHSQFPLSSNTPGKVMTGEASPYYLFHPHAPKRIARNIPHVKLIVLLRNPVDRAYSHYQQQVRKGTESLSFEDAIKQEEIRLKPEISKMLRDENYHSTIYQFHSYLARGRYMEQLKVWMQLFPREQFLILKSEEFYSKPAMIVNEVLDFLGLPKQEGKQYTNSNPGDYLQLDTQLRNELSVYFKPYNDELYKYLGIDFGW